MENEEQSIKEKAARTALELVEHAKEVARIGAAIKKLDNFHEEFKTHATQELIDTAKRDEQIKDHIDRDDERFADIGKTLEEMRILLKDTNIRLEPILDIYRAAIVSKSFILGLGAVIVAITAIGVGITWFIRSVK